MSQSVSVFSNVCPQCHQGQVFNFFYSINKQCPHCGMLFEKEEGYFFGPMIVSYFATLFAAVPVLLFMAFKLETSGSAAMWASVAVIAILGPIFYRYSKLIWLHLETGFAKKMKAEQERADQIARDRKGV